jgi:hypothetical protein
MAGRPIAACEFSLARPNAGRAAANRMFAARQLAAAAIENAVAFGDPEFDGVGAAIPLKVVAR